MFEVHVENCEATQENEAFFARRTSNCGTVVPPRNEGVLGLEGSLAMSLVEIAAVVRNLGNGELGVV